MIFLETPYDHTLHLPITNDPITGNLSFTDATWTPLGNLDTQITLPDHQRPTDYNAQRIYTIHYVEVYQNKVGPLPFTIRTWLKEQAHHA